MKIPRQEWLRKAERLKPTLRVSHAVPAKWDRKQLLGRRDAMHFDFGRHLVGHVTIKLSGKGIEDAPTRFRCIFGERMEDLELPPEPYVAHLSRAWVQDEVITVDHLPATVAFPRRYAFRYLKLEIIDTSPNFKARVDEIHCAATTSADDSAVPKLPRGTPADLARIDAVGLATLRSCMQTVFEDGPKRDRRLWTGDLRLQAQANAYSFRNFDLVRRSLYLLGAFPRKNGWFAADVYEHPEPRTGGCLIPDYSVMLGPILLDHLEYSGDQKTAKELFPVARLQFALAKRVLRDGLIERPAGWWFFSDWRPGLDQQAPSHATILYAAKQVVRLAELLGEDPGAAASMIEPMTVAARSLLDTRRGLFVSGKKRQISWASAAWMVLAGVVEGEEARRILKATLARRDAIRPAGPYLYHHVVEALLSAGMDAEASGILRSYWGAMVAGGADTYDEVFDPEDPKLAPYGHISLNSHCHAWSCTPVYFIRRYGKRLW